MLQALFQMARDDGLMADPDFEPKPVAWLVRVGDGGKLLSIESTVTVPPASGKRKPKHVAKTFRVPRQPSRTSGDCAFFLCDKPEYVFGLIAPADPDLKDAAKRKRKTQKLPARQALFIEQVRACADATDDEGAIAVLKLLQRVAAGKQSIDLEKDCKPNDLFAFVYASDVDRLVHDRPKIRRYWQKKRQIPAVDGGGGSPMQCLVTGRVISEVGNFNKIKHVPGDNGSDKSLVSFNKAAFASLGWETNENATISREAAEACSTALNRLLSSNYPDPENSHLTLPARHIPLSDDTVVCYWGCGRRADELADGLADLLNPNDPDKVADVYRSLWTGRAQSIDDPSAFYAVTLTGIKGRIIVRDWFETTVGEVWENLAKHFRDLAIVRNVPPPKARALPPIAPLSVLLRSLAPRGDGKGIPDPLAAQFIHAALKGQPYPLSILQKALERSRAEVGGDDWSDFDRRDARASLIKAVLLRRTRNEIGVRMNPRSTSPGYNLGCLMAVLERLQEAALENVNASIIDRYFGAASATPRSVFVRLLRNAQHHSRKARDNPQSAGLAFLLKHLVDEFADRFHVDLNGRGYPSASGIPSFLPLEQQGLFVLGYHQMRKWLWMNKEERSEWNKEFADAPRAFQWGSKEAAKTVER